MVRIGRRDGVATVLVAAIVVPYTGYLVRGSMPFIHDLRGMAATGLVLGLVAAAVLGTKAFQGRWGAAAGLFAVVSGVLGALTFMRPGEGALSQWLLAAFVGPVVVTWALAGLVRTGLVRTESGSRLAR